MQDHPTSLELVNAVAHFLNTELAPTLNDPRLKFRALVAANVLQIVAREMELGDELLRAEWERLNALLTDNAWNENWREEVEQWTRVLAQRIRAGEADDGAFHDEVFAHVEQTVMEKLQITNPRVLRNGR